MSNTSFFSFPCSCTSQPLAWVIVCSTPVSYCMRKGSSDLVTYWHTQKNNEFSYSTSSTFRKCGWRIIKYSFPLSISRFAISYPELNAHLSDLENFENVLCRSRAIPTPNWMKKMKNSLNFSCLTTHTHPQNQRLISWEASTHIIQIRCKNPAIP